LNFVNNRNFTAGGNINVCRFVTPSVNSDFTVIQATATTLPIGISQMGQKGPPGVSGVTDDLAAASGDTLRVYGQGEETLLELGSGGIQAGQYLQPDANGKGVAAPFTTGTIYIGAYALESGSAGEKVRVQVLRFPKMVIA